MLTTNRRAYRVNRVNRPPNFAGTRETTTHEGEWGSGYLDGFARHAVSQ